MDHGRVVSGRLQDEGVPKTGGLRLSQEGPIHRIRRALDLRDFTVLVVLKRQVRLEVALGLEQRPPPAGIDLLETSLLFSMSSEDPLSLQWVLVLN